jgi:hypothetical protein
MPVFRHKSVGQRVTEIQTLVVDIFKIINNPNRSKLSKTGIDKQSK